MNIKAQSVTLDGSDILSIIKEGPELLRLIRLRWPSFKLEELHTFSGKKNLLLAKIKDVFLISIDEKLWVSHDLNEWTLTLKLRSPNIIWHACEVPDGIVISEYGQTSTSLFVSDNGGKTWKRILSNINVDPLSDHFHHVCYDEYRNTLYVTLGDGNFIRAIEVYGPSWKPIYKGPWQFAPIIVDEDRVLFGFDSGITKGGIGVYYPLKRKWTFLFLRPLDKEIKRLQMNELIKIGHNLWISTLGSPQAIIATANLKEWSLVYLEDKVETFNHNISLRTERDQEILACSTGKKLVIFKKSEVISAINSKIIANIHLAYLDRLHGLFSTLKTSLKFKLTMDLHG